MDVEQILIHPAHMLWIFNRKYFGTAMSMPNNLTQIHYSGWVVLLSL